MADAPASHVVGIGGLHWSETLEVGGLDVRGELVAVEGKTEV